MGNLPEGLVALTADLRIEDDCCLSVEDLTGRPAMQFVEEVCKKHHVLLAKTHTVMLDSTDLEGEEVADENGLPAMFILLTGEYFRIEVILNDAGWASELKWHSDDMEDLREAG